MRGPAVASCGNDKIHIQDLFLQWSISEILSWCGTADFNSECVAVLLHIEDLPAAHDAMRPQSLVGTQLAALVIYALVQVLDQLQADNAVIGSTCIPEQVPPVAR